LRFTGREPQQRQLLDLTDGVEKVGVDRVTGYFCTLKARGDYVWPWIGRLGSI
jgi:hypothetical protein